MHPRNKDCFIQRVNNLEYTPPTHLGICRHHRSVIVRSHVSLPAPKNWTNSPWFALWRHDLRLNSEGIYLDTMFSHELSNEIIV